MRGLFIPYPMPSEEWERGKMGMVQFWLSCGVLEECSWRGRVPSGQKNQQGIRKIQQEKPLPLQLPLRRLTSWFYFVFRKSLTTWAWRAVSTR